MKLIDELLDKFIEEYDRARDGISQCLSSYELRCQEIIHQISISSSVEQCEEYFNELQRIQGRLGKILFSREIYVGERLSSLTKAFDRLDDDETRKYWFEKFHQGVSWPTV